MYNVKVGAGPCKKNLAVRKDGSFRWWFGVHYAAGGGVAAGM